MKRKLSTLFFFILIVFTITACGPKSISASKRNENESTVQHPDISDDTDSLNISPVESSPNSPAKIGDWIETMRYSSKDSKYHTVYYRIIDIVRDPSETQSIIDAFNSEDHATTFDKPADPLELCILKYEVMFPKDFPDTKEGIPHTDLSFNITTTEGGVLASDDPSDTSLSCVYDISPVPMGIHPGDTFVDGIAVFTMEKGFSDYEIENSYYLNNTKFANYIKGI